MMKKSGPEPKKQKETKVVELDDKMKNTIHNLTLVMGDWRKLFNIPISNILIARAMNHTVRRDGLIINGYWITGRKIYLIIKCTKYRVEDTLKKFAKRLGKEIRKYLKYSVNPCKALQKKYKKHYKSRKWKPYFKECILWNENLVKLLTGRKVTYSYYSPALTKLKYQIDNFNYCSALDYTGAVGPVIVKQLKY